MVIITPGVATPRALMQAWLASITTATPERLQMLADAVGDLRGQPLLHLQPPGVAVQHAGELGDADDAVARQIGDRRLADDRREVMLAMRLERDVLQEHDLVIAADLLEGAAEMMRGILLIAARIFLPGAGDPRRRVEQPLAVGIVAGPADQGAHRLLDVVGHRDLAAARGPDRRLRGLAVPWVRSPKKWVTPTGFEPVTY